jgi:hypothetical protein
LRWLGGPRDRIRTFLLVEGAAFATAASVHFGIRLDGYQHRQAGIAESVIALALLLVLVLSWTRLASTRTAGLVAQGFALLGTLVGILTIAIGVGPRTPPDMAYHVGVVAVLVRGLSSRHGRRPRELQNI